MPYIDEESRALLAEGTKPATPGELNYVVTLVITEYLRTCGRSYQTINDILGALDGASKEFYRRVAAPYEDTKIVLNGDVY